MTPLGSIFFDFNLPNATTWFYFSLLLAVALFFKFSRFLSMRNWDVVTLFLLVPGLLLLQEGRPGRVAPERNPAVAVARLVGHGSLPLAAPGTSVAGVAPLAVAADPGLKPTDWLWFGYLWLLCGSAYFLVRCLIDLVLVRRPALSPNLNFSGLAWLGGALFVCLIAVAVRQPDRRPVTVGKSSAPLDLAQRPPVNLVKETAVGTGTDFETRFWVGRALAILCHLAVVAGLIVVGCRHFQDASAGMAAATFYLMIPYTGLHVGQLHHVWPVALMVWAVAFYRVPLVAGVFLGLAAGTVYFPALAFPVWFSFYRGRGAGRFAAAFVLTAGLCLGVVGLLLWLDGELALSVQSALSLSDWQPWKVPTTEGFWKGVHWAYRIPIFIAYLAFLTATAIWPTPKNLAHVLALSAAALIGIQFWYADQGGVYVLWYLPLLLLLVFRPNLSDRRPAPIPPETDWLRRWGRALGRLAAWVVKPPEPVSPVR
jgi:hypothetical protein